MTCRTLRKELALTRRSAKLRFYPQIKQDEEIILWMGSAGKAGRL